MTFNVWVNKLLYIQIVEYYSSVQRNKVLICLISWIIPIFSANLSKRVSEGNVRMILFKHFLGVQNDRGRKHQQLS